MGLLTVQVIDGFEKGRMYSDLPTPVTIGREEDNTIQLNDERISRFHAKIQEEGGRYILTDLDSTNGTRVNGHPIHMRIMQVGDTVSVGRSVLLFGSPDQIQERGRHLSIQSGGTEATGNQTVALASMGRDSSEPLFPDGPPDLPDAMRPVQAAQLSDLLGFIHEHLAGIVEAARENLQTNTPEMRADFATWQRLLHLEMDIARYIRKIAEPDREK
jgi:pSer/pThr/pTyr-binding forkhead associated (FHA) protein